jgi:chorismate mutase
MENDLKIESFRLNGMEILPPYLIAGPCSAENEEQTLRTAMGLAAGGVKIFRAGIWKPRTRPGSFEGIGSAGFPWLSRVKQETGMALAVEVATAHHVEEALNSGIDIVWVGARTTANPFAVQEVAEALRGVQMPVLIKNPINPDIELWIGAFERLNRAGVNQLGAIHRGFSSLNGSIYRNQPLWDIPLRFKELFPSIPMINDPSHISGKRALVFQVARKALSFGFEGLMIESHYDPEVALSDKDQQFKPEDLLIELNRMREDIAFQTAEGEGDELENLRKSIDLCDHDLLVTLVNRMMVSEKIGNYKKRKSMAVVQGNRWNEMLESRLSEGKQIGLSEDFIKGLFNYIHKESVNKQMEE